mmetsp:Transcript_23812/g.75468  ORF Transcript_23812/g.75468 Transcript_23812/m.75468 type:complete len:295 (+) Transcript_23812:163-1047(+)
MMARKLSHGDRLAVAGAAVPRVLRHVGYPQRGREWNSSSAEALGHDGQVHVQDVREYELVVPELVRLLDLQALLFGELHPSGAVLHEGGVEALSLEETHCKAIEVVIDVMQDVKVRLDGLALPVEGHERPRVLTAVQPQASQLGNGVSGGINIGWVLPEIFDVQRRCIEVTETIHSRVLAHNLWERPQEVLLVRVAFVVVIEHSRRVATGGCAFRRKVTTLLQAYRCMLQPIARRHSRQVRRGGWKMTVPPGWSPDELHGLEQARFVLNSLFRPADRQCRGEQESTSCNHGEDV